MTPLFPRQEDFEQSIKLVTAGDRTGYGTLLQRATKRTEAGTSVRVLERSLVGAARIRVLDGPNVGADGWTTIEHLGP